MKVLLLIERTLLGIWNYRKIKGLSQKLTARSRMHNYVQTILHLASQNKKGCVVVFSIVHTINLNNHCITLSFPPNLWSWSLFWWSIKTKWQSWYLKIFPLIGSRFEEDSSESEIRNVNAFGFPTIFSMTEKIEHLPPIDMASLVGEIMKGNDISYNSFAMLLENRFMSSYLCAPFYKVEALRPY